LLRTSLSCSSSTSANLRGSSLPSSSSAVVLIAVSPISDYDVMGQSFPRAANIIHQASEIINLFGGQLKK